MTPRYRDLEFTRAVSKPSTKTAIVAILGADSGADVYVNEDGHITGVRCGPEHSSDIAEAVSRDGINVRFGSYRPDIGRVH